MTLTKIDIKVSLRYRCGLEFELTNWLVVSFWCRLSLLSFFLQFALLVVSSVSRLVRCRFEVCFLCKSFPYQMSCLVVTFILLWNLKSNGIIRASNATLYIVDFEVRSVHDFISSNHPRLRTIFGRWRNNCRLRWVRWWRCVTHYDQLFLYLLKVSYFEIIQN